MIAWELMLCTIPFSISPSLSAKASYKASLSASRIRCSITCLAVWAAIRPKFEGVVSTKTVSPRAASSTSSLASAKEICERLSSTSSTTSFSVKILTCPESGSILAVILARPPKSRL